METVSPVRVFISYAWEDDEYREWVRSLATQLRDDGVDVRLDRWDLEEGDTIAGFMNREERHADKVLVLCSPLYRIKVHAMEDRERVTGSGWETQLLTSTMFNQGLTDKALPVLARGTWEESAPSFLQGYLYTDLTVSDEKTLEENYYELLRRIFEIREERPIPGTPPLEKLASEPARPFFKSDRQSQPRAEERGPPQPDTRSGDQSRDLERQIDRYLESKDRLWCLVLISETRAKTKRLEATVKQALQRKWDQISPDDPEPTLLKATVTDVLAYPEVFKKFVICLCQAEFAVFDMTEFEPAMMLLIGLRSVVKRGVTVVTVDHDLPAKEWVKIPFSLKQISPIAHVPADFNDPKNPVKLMAETFAEGWRQLRAMPHYLDLPAYDDVRRLGTKPQDYLPIPWPRAMLWMCSFHESYLDHNYKSAPQSLIGAFGEQAEEEEKAAARNMEIKLIIDIVSPRLMSQRTYEAIRRYELCVIDWTHWRPNVFFEFGVRLAVSDKDPVNIIDPALETPEDIASHGPQQQNLLKKLFKPHGYDGEETTPDDFADACQKWLQQESNGSLGYGAVFNEISRAIDIDQESASLPLHKELLDSANRMTGDDDRMAGSFPTLYSTKNDTLKQHAKQGAWERQLATWLYFHELWTTDPGRIREDDQLRENIEELATRMQLRLYDEPQLDKNDLMGRIENLLTEILTSHVNGEGNA